MNCRQAEKLIPLHVGGDLEGKVESRLRDHLGTCSRCARLAEEFRESRGWLVGLASLEPSASQERGAPDVIAALRQPVPAERQSGLRLRIAAGVILAALLVGLILFLQQRQSGTDGPGATTEVVNTPPAGGQHEAEAERSGDGTRSAQRAAVAAAGSRVRSRRARVTATRRADVVATRGASVQEKMEPTRIEMFTSDPNIRIIWFVSSESEAADDPLRSRRPSSDESD